MQPYAWALPEDTTPLQQLVRDLVDGKLTAILFTTQVQARHLFAVAETMNMKDRLTAALTKTVTVGAIGPTTATALADAGITAPVMPAQSSMGALVLALARTLGSTSPS